MRFRSIIKIILPVLIIAIAIGIFQHLKAGKPERSKPELKEKVWQVEVVSVEKQSLSPVLGLYGRVESPEMLQAAAPGAGIISEVLVQSGTRVTAGQTLVKMDNRDFESVLVQAESDLKDIENQIGELKIRHQSNLKALETELELLQLANEEVQRLVKLKAQNLTADTILSVARSARGRQQLVVYARELEVESYSAQMGKLMARRDQNQAYLKQARLMVERSTVLAPFDAVISSAPVSVGDRVATGQILVALYPIDSLEIRAHIPAQYIARIQQTLTQEVSQQASIEIADSIHLLELKRLAGEAEPSGIDAFFHAGDAAQQLRPGGLLPLSFKLPAEDDVVAVPYQAIYGNSRLYLLNDDRLQGVDVESLGQYIDADGTSLLLVKSSQIKNGDEIVVTHLPNAVSGLKVKGGG
ncbi:MAG: efflux RND transporter periplasmic adaptor subunit [Gammaproteobacteria bacterium]